MASARRQAGGLFVATLLYSNLGHVGVAQSQFIVPEAGTVGAGSFPSERAAAEVAANGGTAPEPSASPAIRLNAQGFPVGVPAGEPGVDSRRVRFTPSIGGQLIAIDNVNGTVRDRKADLIATITPGININADTPRLLAVINYQPTAQFYLGGNAPNRINHFGSGQILATLIPERFFLDLRGSSSVQSLTGGQSTQAGVLNNSGNGVQTSSFIVSPYYVQRFGTFATARVGYTFQQVNQSLGGTLSGSSVNAGNAAQVGFRNSDFTAHQIYGVVRTGPDFGRVALQGAVDSTNYVGSGVLDGAYRRIASLEGRYAIRRGVYALVEGGYEQQRYGGTPGFRLSGPIWSLGARFDFSPESFLVARYGRRDGFNSASLEASVAVGGRTRVVARYGERLTTTASRSADLLTTTTLDELGNPIDLATGQPAATVASGSFLGIQSNLLRVRSGLASVVQQWPRDTLSLSFIFEDQSVVSVVPGVAAFPQKVLSGAFTWAHSLTERTVGSVYLQYGKVTNAVATNGDVATVSLTLQHQLQERLAGTLQITSTVRSDGQSFGGFSQPFAGGSQSGGRVVQNFVLLGLRQTF